MKKAKAKTNHSQLQLQLYVQVNGAAIDKAMVAVTLGHIRGVWRFLFEAATALMMSR